MVLGSILPFREASGVAALFPSFPQFRWGESFFHFVPHMYGCIKETLTLR